MSHDEQPKPLIFTEEKPAWEKKHVISPGGMSKFYLAAFVLLFIFVKGIPFYLKQREWRLGLSDDKTSAECKMDVSDGDLKGLPREGLRTLKLSQVFITDDGLANIRRQTQLESLNLSGSRNFTSAGLVNLQDMTALTHLKLADCHQINDAGLRHLRGLTRMLYLDLSKCTDITDKGLAHLQDMTEIYSLNLSCCHHITDAGLAHLEKMTGLLHLNLAKASISHRGLSCLKQMKNMASLNLSECGEIDDIGLAHLADMRELRQLNLSGCLDITDEGLRILSELNSLQTLDISGCVRITDAGLEHLLKLPDLQQLYIQDRRFIDGYKSRLRQRQGVAQSPALQRILGSVNPEELKALEALAGISEKIGTSSVTEEAVQRFKEQKPGCTVYR